MKTYKKNLPEGVKKQFALYKGVKVRLINKNKKKINNFNFYRVFRHNSLYVVKSSFFLTKLFLYI